VADTLVYDTQLEQLNPDKYVTIIPDLVSTPHPWAKCLNYKKDLFIGIDGLVAPCPWFNNGYQPNDFIKKYKDRLSIHNRSFFEIINDVDLWQQLVKSFNDGPLEICQLKCKNG
jgi:hypothetical protein